MDLEFNGWKCISYPCLTSVCLTVKKQRKTEHILGFLLVFINNFVWPLLFIKHRVLSGLNSLMTKLGIFNAFGSVEFMYKPHMAMDIFQTRKIFQMRVLKIVYNVVNCFLKLFSNCFYCDM